MPLCWIFLLKRRRALSNVSFSPTRTSANRCSPPPTGISHRASGARPTGLDAGLTTVPKHVPREPPEHKRWSRAGQTPHRGRCGPYHRSVETLVDLLDGAAERYGDRPALRLRGDDESTEAWSYRELQLRSKVAAWRLRALGLEPGDRILTWSPSTPELPAAYFGAMRAGLVLVPLDLRMAPDAIERIAARADAKRLLIGTGRDAPDPREAGLASFPTTRLDELAAPADHTMPADWEALVGGWP